MIVSKLGRSLSFITSGSSSQAWSLKIALRLSMSMLDFGVSRTMSTKCLMLGQILQGKTSCQQCAWWHGAYTDACGKIPQEERLCCSHCMLQVNVIRKHRHHDEDMGGRRSFLLVQYCCMKPDKARKYKKVSSANCFFWHGIDEATNFAVAEVSTQRRCNSFLHRLESILKYSKSIRTGRCMQKHTIC